MPTHDLPHPRTAPRCRRALALSVSVLTALLTTAPAAVADDSGKGDQPPASMSTIGGALLGEPGPQVKPLDGAPRLPDTLSARSWIVADAETGEVLAAHNAHWPLAPASTVKMLLADTLLPKFDKDQEYVAQPEHFVEMGAGSSAVGISDHQTYTVDDLWHGVFLASGNDAVYALAAMNGGKKKTVDEMNERAAELQALDTKVVNPDGYDGKGQVSSAYDLTLIARSGMRNEQFRAYAATGSFDFPGAGKGRKRETFQVQSTNRLLVGASGLQPYEGLAGIKNGYTSTAGYTFTGIAERDDRVLLVTCMNPSGDGLQVYREAAELLDWGFEAADKVEPVGELVPPLSEIADDEDIAAQEDGKGDAPPMEGAANADGDERSIGGGAVLGLIALGLGLLGAGAFAYHRLRPRPGRKRRVTLPRW